MENTLNNANSVKKSKALKNIMLIGLILRVAILIFMLAFATSFTEPYFLADDIKYEDSAEIYMLNSTSFFDIRQLSNISDRYIAPFWPWVVSIFAYIFKWKYIGRIINIILSVMTIKLVHNITFNISENDKTALQAAKMMAFLPVTVLTCCFPIKDIFIMFAVFYVFDFFIKLQKGYKLEIYNVIIVVLIMVALYYSRGAVTELLILFFFAFYIIKYVRKNNYLAVIAIIALAAAVLYIFGDIIVESFTTKIEDYGGVTSEGGIAALTVNSIFEIYKLPFAVFFANLQPVKMNLFVGSTVSWWYSVIAYLNISLYPLAFANALYMLEKKKNMLFWVLSYAMYSAVISLSLGVFRHYLFLIPLQMINSCLYFESETKEKRLNKEKLVLLGSFCLLFYLLYYSVRLEF